MANPENVTNANSKRTPKERRDFARNAGKASGKARRERKSQREFAKMLLDMPIDEGDIDEITHLKDAKGKNLTAGQAALVVQMQKAIKGDLKAYELVRDTAGEKPVERVEVNNDVQKAMGEISDFLSEIDDEGGK